ncbi:FMN-dependent NADH-azoreductase [Crossiella sp. CA198]|uniref:FMN-dependent NADH-azoreductase n=1 Tax=Crossiella sp. CA198 TaxID=3455607 RepID=UPI003F8D20E5
MAKLLHIDSSSSVHSVSRKLAAEFRAVWEKEHPEGTVAYRDLAADPVPHPDHDAVLTLMSPPRTERQQAAATLHEELVAELLAADALLISAPMYNWTIPSTLKAWLDQSLVLGRTLPFDPSHQPLGGRPATVLLAYGGSYGADSPDADMDHCAPYLRTVLGKVLGYELELITVEHTLAAFTAKDPAEQAKGFASLRSAEAAVAERAQRVAESLVQA